VFIYKCVFIKLMTVSVCLVDLNYDGYCGELNGGGGGGGGEDEL
jgi:hypothetical protein